MAIYNALLLFVHRDRESWSSTADLREKLGRFESHWKVNSLAIQKEKSKSPQVWKGIKTAASQTDLRNLRIFSLRCDE